MSVLDGIYVVFCIQTVGPETPSERDLWSITIINIVNYFMFFFIFEANSGIKTILSFKLDLIIYKCHLS